MKGQLPIIIALVLVASLTVTTIIYTTSTITHTSLTVLETGSAGEWTYLTEQLDGILLSALSAASPNASRSFETTYWSLYRDSVIEYGSWTRTTIIEDGCPRIRWGIFCTATLWTLYNYDDFRCIGKCDSNYTSPGFSWSMSNYTFALQQAAHSYFYRARMVAEVMLNNWRDVLASYGYVIYTSSIGGFYRIDIASYGNYSESSAVMRLNATLDIYSATAGYRRMIRYVEVGYTARFYSGLWSDDGIYLPVYVNAYVDLNGVKAYYIINPDETSLTVYSVMLKRLTFLNTTGGNVTLKPIVSYYYGNGTTLLIFRIDAIDRNMWNQEGVVWRNVVLSHRDYDDTFSPPFTIADPSSKLRRVTVAFLWAGLLSTRIEGINLYNGVKIVFKHYANTRPGGWYDWLDSVPFNIYGDERAVFPPEYVW
ncbi:MAG: hypothetical protein ACO2OS_00770 [Thermosphaera aggregans]|uniref:hypothetical protein n=1 Tax=Thermosphaera aggregans TaxID=54254 RepID=UPI003C08DAEF